MTLGVPWYEVRMASPPPGGPGPQPGYAHPPPGQPGYGPQYGQPGYGPQGPPPKKTSSCLVAGIVAAVLAVPLLGVVAALGIYGVRRYLVAAKTAEAKTSIAAIARGSVAAYERDSAAQGSGATLCPTAVDVPGRVPSAKKYMPVASDFDAASGWDCLEFRSSVPMYYQLSYRQGADYRGPARGGVDPGVDGFEAAATGDLDGDAQTSLFVITGEVANGNVRTAPSVFVDAQFE